MKETQEKLVNINDRKLQSYMLQC